jgi:glucose/arabinose dehydrogenase
MKSAAILLQPFTRDTRGTVYDVPDAMSEPGNPLSALVLRSRQPPQFLVFGKILALSPPMKPLKVLLCAVVVALVTLWVPVGAAIQLTQIVSGLSSPLFVGHAGDGSGRLFIVERGGVIKVLQPGASTPTVFLNITSKVQSGGEQGLLGLAFHPLYESTGRFFVFYTRSGGDIVVAEYHVSANPNVADTVEEILLTIPHPTNTNHNGGMLAFGPDNLLYIGVGDGGGANDVPNNAQNRDVLLARFCA